MKKPPKKATATTAVADPDGFEVWTKRFLQALAVKGHTEKTVQQRGHALDVFIGWCAERSITRPAEVTKPIVESYQRHLYHRRLPSGRPLSFSTQHSLLVPVKMLFRWLARQNVILSNPASDIELPKLPLRLPRHVLTPEEAEAVLAQPDVKTTSGLRDRAILETLYSTGMRRMELIGLHLYDVDAERGTLMIRDGKGRRDRVVPTGERAAAWIRKYIDEARPDLVTDPNDTVLFVTNRGDPFPENSLTYLAQGYIEASGIGKRGACHVFRHSMATAMLENGADVRFIQAMLGHARLSSTEVYTHVAIRKLIDIHSKTHPGATLSRKPKVTKAERDELLASLEEDADDET